MAEAVLRIRDVAKTFPGTMALRGIDLDLYRGEVHALLGANGCGKSTLVKILSGYQDADPGSAISVAGAPLPPASPRASYDAGLRFVHQDLALVDDLSVADNVLLTSGWPTRLRTISRRRAHARVRAALDELGADLAPEAPVRTLSPAMRTIVAMARALLRDRGDADPITALVLDEPTATLPRHEVAVLTRVVREVARRGTAVLVISHHLQEALDLADVVTVLRDGRKVLSAPSAALTRTDVITAMMGEDYEERLRERPAVSSADPRLECAGLHGTSFADVTFTVRAGEVVGIAGLEGSGRDDLLPTIFGDRPRYHGTIAVDGRPLPPAGPQAAMAAGLAYVPADRNRLAAIPELTGRENLTVADLAACSRWGRVDRAGERRSALDWFDRVGVRPPGAIEQRLADFSGGNQQKIVLARCLRRRPRVLLLDEPTQGIDVAAQAALHSLLLDAARRDGIGIVVSSSDEEELAAICHRVLVLRRGRIAGELRGSAITPSAIADQSAHVVRKEPV
ncbi:sugar ABC transporter ATP-binding protein [Thermopolyspora sp. NPDC052614]|uniref:sugar ABC transporter ATP-binding protein n=1 Tax=Thermopolyspora sp. NPDC052614 TaxID=3155682 RepID=UPI0034312E48